MDFINEILEIPSPSQSQLIIKHWESWFSTPQACVMKLLWFYSKMQYDIFYGYLHNMSVNNHKNKKWIYEKKDSD